MTKLIAAQRFYFDGLPIGKTDPLTVMNRMFAGWFCADRFGILNKHSCFDVAEFNEKFPTAKNLKIADICDERAIELMKQNKPIVVLWSGGVDSTAIVCSFLKNNIPLDQLTVAYSAMTEEEYPYFLQVMKAQGINVIRQDDIPTYCDELRDCLAINGWCADQLFGSDIHRFNSELYNYDWMNGIREMMKVRRIRLTERSFNVIEQIYSDYAKRLGLNVKHFCEFTWMYNFGIKWSYVREVQRMLCTRNASRECVVNFFETDDFQSWSVNNFENIKLHNVFKEPKWYKKELKQYIFDYNHDEDYFLNKPKVNSRSTVKPEGRRVFVLNTDGYHIFQYKSKSEDNISALQQKISEKYLKHEY